MAKQNKTLVGKELLARIAVINREIKAGRFPNKERLARSLSVSTKTIQRDIEYMKFEHNAPIEFDKLRRGFYYTDDRFNLNPLTVDASDFLAVAVTEKVLEQYKNTPYSKYFKNFYRKIENIFEGKLSVNINDIDKILSFYVGPVRYVSEEVMNVCERGLRENIRCKMTYMTGYSGAVSERLIDIYHLKNFNGNWYLIGYCHKAKKIKVFALSRIKEIKLTNQYFDVPDDFSIERYFENSFGIFESDKLYNVKLKIMNESVRYVKEKKGHISEKITEQKDGSIILEYKVNNLTDLSFFVLSLGRDCEVISPKEFREDMIKELKEALKNYK
ncbi:MAG: WYL domain-containing protein [Ignavibacteria bacterium]